MAVDKTWEHHAAAGVDFVGVTSFSESFDTPARADLANQTVADEDGSIGDDTELTKRVASAWRCGTAQRQQLTGVPNQNWHYTFRRRRAGFVVNI